MSRFLVAMFVGAIIAAAASTSASAWHCLATVPTAQPARPSASYWEEPSQSQCAGAYTAAVGLVAQSHGAGRTEGRTTRRTQLTRTRALSRPAKFPLRSESDRVVARPGADIARPFRLLVGMQSVSHCHKPRFLIAVGRVSDLWLLQ